MSQKLVKIRKFGKNEPSYQTVGSSGFDIIADENRSIKPGQWKLIKTGLFVEIPPGYEIQIRPRSGLAMKYGVTVLNAPGTIDSDYRGEIGVILINLSNLVYDVKVGDRIAQGVLMAVEKAFFVDVSKMEELETTERADGGYGSTGK